MEKTASSSARKSDVSDCWLIRNGRALDPATRTIEPRDIRIRDGRLAETGLHLAVLDDESVFDARGCYVTPGLLDMHSHLREPGQTHKETIETGTRAAAAGGFTRVVCMANTSPPVDTPELVRFVLETAARTASARVYPVAAISKGLAGREPSDWAALREAGAIAFSDDGKTCAHRGIMRDALRASAEGGFPLLLHCEDERLARNGVMNAGAVADALGVPGLTPRAEEKIIERDLQLAEETKGHAHICHVSTAHGVELVRQAKARGVSVTAEACPHHFTLTDEAVRIHHANAKMNPPLRTQRDVEAVIGGLRDGTLDAIATDHAPHSVEEKAKGLLDAPFGIIGFELCLPLAWTTLVERGLLTPLELMRKLTVEPARILRLREPSLQPGEPADVVVVDPSMEITVTEACLYSKSRNTPFIGWTLRGWPLLTLCQGRQTFLRPDARDRLRRKG